MGEEGIARGLTRILRISTGKTLVFNLVKIRLIRVHPHAIIGLDRFSEYLCLLSISRRADPKSCWLFMSHWRVSLRFASSMKHSALLDCTVH